MIFSQLHPFLNLLFIDVTVLVSGCKISLKQPQIRLYLLRILASLHWRILIQKNAFFPADGDRNPRSSTLRDYFSELTTALPPGGRTNETRFQQLWTHKFYSTREFSIALRLYFGLN